MSENEFLSRFEDGMDYDYPAEFFDVAFENAPNDSERELLIDNCLSLHMDKIPILYEVISVNRADQTICFKKPKP